MEALVLFLLYSGLRISDACLSGPSRLNFQTGELFVRSQEKTGQPVTTSLPLFVVEKLKSLPLLNGKYWFFYTGSGKVETATGNARRTFRKLFQLAKVPDGHPHRFRDTFAVRLLNSGAKMEDVSILLGHRSLKITEKHYAPFVRSRADHVLRVSKQAWAAEGLETLLGVKPALMPASSPAAARVP
jgi:integrase